MRASLVLGLELPPVPAADAAQAGPGPLPLWWRIADAGIAAGAVTLWLTDGPDDGVAGPARWCDPSTLAGGMAARWPMAHLGVVASLPGGRHPSVVAREASTLDVLSGGRAAVQMRWRAPPPVDPATACDHLADAVAVCAAMLRGGDPAYGGPAYRISGAVNVPSPLRASGVPVLVAPPPELTAELVAAGRRREAATARARGMVALADAVVCGEHPGEVAAWHAVVDAGREAAPAAGPADRDSTGAPGAGARGRRPALLCSVPADPAGGTEPARLAARARDAGADGVILRVAHGFAVEPARGSASDPGAMSALMGVASDVYAPWRDRGT